MSLDSYIKAVDHFNNAHTLRRESELMNGASRIRIGDVTLACEELEKSVDELCSVLGDFRGRLVKVTRPEPCTEPSGELKGAGKVSACELSEIIRAQKRRLNSMIDSIRIHINLLEL